MSAIFYGASIIPLIFLSKAPGRVHSDTPAGSRNPFRNFQWNKKLVIYSVFFSAVIFSIFLINPLISQFMHNVYHQSILNLGLFGTATYSGWFVFSFLLGRIGDKRSKMAAVLTSTTICSFSYLLISTFNNVPLLIAASFFSGASSCILGFVPAIIGSSAPECYRGRWISIGQTTVNLASFGAPILGGTLYQISPYLAFLTTISLLLTLTVIAKIKRY